MSEKFTLSVPDCTIPDEVRRFLQKLAFSAVPDTHLTDYNHDDIAINTAYRHDAVTIASNDPGVTLSIDSHQRLSVSVDTSAMNIDHTDLSNIGVNTHAQIDTKLNDIEGDISDLNDSVSQNESDISLNATNITGLDVRKVDGSAGDSSSRPTLVNDSVSDGWIFFEITRDTNGVATYARPIWFVSDSEGGKWFDADGNDVT